MWGHLGGGGGGGVIWGYLGGDWVGHVLLAFPLLPVVSAVPVLPVLPVVSAVPVLSVLPVLTVPCLPPSIPCGTHPGPQIPREGRVWGAM